MSPTKQQIDQAERLQAAGLCQMADMGIWKHNHSGEYFFSKNAKDGKNWKCIEITGPLPTFEEVWSELFDMLKIDITSFKAANEIFIKITFEMNKNPRLCRTPTTAAIEALLLLKGEG